MINKLCGKSFLLRALANFFIFFCICRSIFMCWPFDQQYNPRVILRPFNEISSYLSLNANLNLFSPNPTGIVDDVKFVVTFDDGTTQDWKFPRDKMLPWDSEGSYGQHVRNVLFWNTQRSVKRIRPNLARYVARQTASADKHPVRVDFLHGSIVIPPLEEGTGKALVHPQQYEKCFSYAVQPGDLN